MEENRLRALEKKGRATQPLVSAALTPAVTTASNSTAKTLFASTTTGGNRAAMGESGQKMLERKVQATAPSSPVLPKNDSTIKCPPHNTCHNKQKAGMEENQGIALEKKGRMTAQLPTAAVMSLAAATASVMTTALNGTTNNTCTSSTITGDNCAQMDNTGQTSLEFFASGNVFHYYEDEVGADTTCQMDKCSSPSRHNDKQPAQMKENQRRALEKTLPPSQPLATAASASVLPPSAKVAANSCPSSKITDDNCVKTGGNRQSGLKERKETSSSLKTSSEVDVPQNDDQCEPVMPAPVKMPCHTMGNEHEEADVPIEDQMTGVEEICHLDLEKPELEASMPSTDVCIDSNVTNNMNPPAEIMPAPSPPPGPPKVDPDEKASLTPTKTATTKMSPVKPASARKSALPPIPQELQYEHSRVLPIIDGDTDTLIKNAELDQPLLNGMTLYEHQKEGVKRALRMRRLILAFDMGLGKTIIGCVWAKAFLKTFEGIKIFVIAPVSLQGEWKNNAVEATGLKAVLKVDLDEKKKKKKKVKEKPKKRKTVTGKRKKGKKKVDPVSDDEEVEECQSSKNDFDLYVFSWSSLDALKKVIVDVGISDYVVICDEAHMMQSMESKRTKAALKLMESKKCLGSLMLTGTPMKNGKPSNLFPLLKAVKHPFGDKQKKYEFYFCNGQHRTIGSRGPAWDASGSSNLKELNAHTGTHIFRMTKEECLKDLPPRKREFKQIPVAPLHELRYTQKLKDLAEVFTSAQKYGNNGGNDEILTSFQQLRQISSTAKVEAIVQLANRILLEESSIVIFTNFVLVAGAIHEKLEGMDWAGELLTGQTKPDKRQAMVDRFQSGLSPVFVCTYGAGGVGLTLTAACTVILVDRPWTPGDVCQAEDRVRRIGQKRPVRSVWIRAFPVDEQIDELINHKAANSSAVVDGKDDDGQNKSAPKVSISELVKSVLGN